MGSGHLTELCGQVLESCPDSPCAMPLGHGGAQHRTAGGFAWTTGYPEGGTHTEPGVEFEGEVRGAVKDLKAMVNSADDQARAMTDAELGDLLLSGRWTTIEVHEAGHRLKRRGE